MAKDEVLDLWPCAASAIIPSAGRRRDQGGIPRRCGPLFVLLLLSISSACSISEYPRFRSQDRRPRLPSRVAPLLGEVDNAVKGGASWKASKCDKLHGKSRYLLDRNSVAALSGAHLRLSGGGRQPKPTVVSAHGRADGDVSDVRVSTLQLGRRACWLAIVFAFPLLTAPLAVLLTPFREIVWYRLLAFSMGRSGAAFIKWAQWASVRPDIFAQPLCDVLSNLQSGAPIHSWRYTRQQLAAALGGCAIEDYFDNIERQAFASGSIAQVYRATVKGRKVAVKVRHPGVEEQISLDFRIMRAVGRFLDALPALGWLNLEASMQQFSHTIASQVRLDIEGNHLDIFNHNFRHQHKWCRFPEALLKTEGVLIESFEQGQLATSLVLPNKKRASSACAQSAPASRAGDAGSALPLASGCHNRGCVSRVLSGLRNWLLRFGGACFGVCGRREEARQEVEESMGLFIVSKGVDTYLKMLLKDNLMHADLHPGNILLQAGAPDKGINPRIVLVDAGMVAQLTRTEQDNFIGLLQAFGRGDGARAAQCLLRFSDSQTCASAEKRGEFSEAMRLMFAEHCRGYDSQVQIGDVIRRCLRMLREHKVRIDVNYATLILNVLCLEGLAAVLRPEYNLLDGARPLLQSYSRLSQPLFPLMLMLKRIVDHRYYLKVRRQELGAAGATPL